MPQFEEPARAAEPPSVASPVFEVSYELTFSDYQALRRAKRSLSPVGQALWHWRYALLIGIFLLIVAFVSWDAGLSATDVFQPDFIAAIAPPLLGTLAFVIAVDVLFDQIIARWIFRRFALANARLSVSAAEAGVSWSSGGISASVPWSRVTRTAKLEDHLFLFISSIEAIGFSRHAFRSAAEFAAFTRYAQEKLHG